MKIIKYSIDLKPALYRKITMESKRTGISRAGLIRMILISYFKEKK